MINYTMKKLLTIITLSTALLLTGCGSDGPALDGTVDGNTYSTSDFSITIPQDWEVLQDFDTTYPETTIMAVRNHVKESDFVANVNVTYSKVEKGIDLNAFASNMLDTHRTTLTNFKEVSRENLSIVVDSAPATSVLNVFEGRQGPEAQMLRFFQTYGYKGDIVYTVTGIHNLSEERFAREKVENTVRSFEIK